MEKIQRVTIIGAGIMGFGIAKSIFKHNIDVTLYDTNEVQLQQSCDKLIKGARRSMDPGKIHKAASLREAVQDCDLLIEAVVEDLNVKCQLFRELGEVAPSDTIFASNTSSLDINQMARDSGRPERFLGLHFFNPAYLMRLIEVVKSEHLSEEVHRVVLEFIEGIKKSGIPCKSSPGFIVNRLLIPTLNEAFYTLDTISDEQTRVEIANDIDSALTEQQIFLMGLFDLTDLTGLDTALAVSERIYEGFNRSPRYVPSPLLRSYVDNGFTGRKTLRGIYYYGNSENDPDLNPRLDESGKYISPILAPRFDFLPLLAVIINESFRILEEGIVDSFTDIDFCMESGSHWPMGPFALLKKYGLETIRDSLLQQYKDSNSCARYEPSSCLLHPPRDIEEYLTN